MKHTTLKNSMLTGLLVTALLTPQGVSYAAVDSLLSSPTGAFIDLQSVSADRLKSIQQAVKLGLIEGNTDGTFRPDDRLTRRELAALLTRALQLPIPSSLDSFEDVASDDWSRSFIAAVKKAGIMVGDDQGHFRPQDFITREEIAVTLVRASEQVLEVDSAPSAVNDWNGVSSWAKAFVKNAIQQGIMPISQGDFKPGEQVLRADVAQMLISAFFPSERASLLQNMQGDHVRINGVTYKLSPEVTGILQDSNREILKGAKLKFRFSGRTLEAITELQLTASGDPVEDGHAEFSGNLVLDGHGAVVDGHVTVAGDYTTVKNLTVNGDFHIAKTLENDFYASKLHVKGNTFIEGGDSNTVVFDNSDLQNVEVNKQEVHVVSQAGTSIQSMTVQSNAVISSDSSSIKQVTLADGAKSVELQGSIDQLTVTSSQPVAVNGNLTVQSLTVNSGTTVSLNATGNVSQLNVNNVDAKVIVGSGTAVTNVTMGSGVPAGAVVTNTSTNNPPYVAVPIDEQKITVGDAEIKIDLSKHFKDSEQSTLKFTGASVSSKIAKAAIVGNILTLSAVAKGSTSVRLIIDDQNGGRINAEFKITVNAPPIVKNAMAPVIYTLGQGAKKVDITSVFADEDNDALSYAVESSDPSVATVAESAGELTLTPVKSGTAVIKVTASDGKGGFGSTNLEVTINEPPTVDVIPDTIIQLSTETQKMDLTPYLHDLENDTLTLTADSSREDIAAVAVDGLNLVWTPAAAGVTQVHISASDGRGGTAERTFNLTVNTIPKIKQAPSDMLLTAGKTASLVLNQIFEDADQDQLTYEAGSSDTAKASVQENIGKVTIQALTRGETDITLKAKDGKGGVVSNTFKLVVNEAPEIRAVPPQTIQVGQGPVEFDLADYLRDADHDPLTVIANTDAPQIATVAVNGMKLILTAVSKGKTNIQLTVNDGRGGVTTSHFELTANAVPKVVQQPANETLTVGKPNKSIDLTKVFSDDDLDTLTYEVSSSNAAIVSASEAAGELSLKPLMSGTSLIQVTAKDGKGGHMTTTFTVTANEAPIISKIPGYTVQLGQGVQAFDLSSYLSDKENDALTITADTVDHSVVTVTVDDQKLRFNPVKAGKTQVNFTVKDGRGGEATGTISLLVNTVPHVQQPMTPMLLTIGQADGSVDLSTFFGDADQDTLTYEISSSNQSAADLSETGGQLTVKPLASGTTTVTVKAKDGKGGEVTTTFTVTVNEAPTIRELSDCTVQLGQGVQAFDLSSYLSDKEKDTLTITADTVDHSVATVAVVNQILRFTPVKAGKTQLNFTVKDGRGGEAMGTISLLVNTVPHVQQPMTPMLLTIGQADGSVDLSTFFGDADQDTLTYEISSSNQSAADLSETGGQLTVKPLASGTTTVTVKAKDGKGGEVSALMTLTVNEAPNVITIPPQYIQLGQGVQQIDLSAYLKDKENDPMTVSAEVVDTSIAAVLVKSLKLDITPVQAGETEVKLVVSDGRGGVTEAVLPLRVNIIPSLEQTIADMIVTRQQDPGKVVLAPIFSDADQDPLTYEVYSADSTLASASEVNGELFIQGLKAGSTTVHVKAKDGKGGEVSTSFKVDVNEAPVITSIPEQMLQLNEGPFELDLTSFLSDPENDSFDLTASTNSTTVATVVVNGKKLTITPINLGEAQIGIHVTDVRGGVSKENIKVHVNVPPVVEQQPSDKTLTVGLADHVVDLAAVFEDANSDTLAYEVSSSQQAVATVSEHSGQLTVHAVASGTSIVTVKAKDGKGGEVSTSFTITANEAPVIRTIPLQFLVTHGAVKELDLAAYLTDKENDLLTIAAESEDDSKLTVTVQSSKLTLKPFDLGQTNVKLTVTDGRGGTTYATFKVRVTVPNEIPVVQHAPQPAILTIGQADAVLDLSTVFSDADNDVLTYEIQSENSAIADGDVTGNELIVHAFKADSTVIQMKAMDDKGGETSASWSITVNTAPTISAIPAQELRKGGAAVVLDVTNFIADADQDSLTVSATSPNTAIATVNVSGNKLTFMPSAVGQTEVKVTVSDGRGGETTQSIPVSVINPNVAPEVVSAISEQVLTKGITNPRTYDMSQLFSDADADALTFIASSSSPAAATASISGNLLTLEPGTGAEAGTVTVTANDGRGGTASYSFTVRTAPLASTGLYKITTKQGAKEEVIYDLSTLFPGQTSFIVYKGTPDSTFTGPAILEGSKITLTDPYIYTWVVASDGRAVVLQLSSIPQGAPEMFFSEYLDAGNGRIAVELFYTGDGDPSHKATGYTIEAHRYWKQTKTKDVISNKIFDTWANTPYVLINNIFYDYFDLTHATYYNDDGLQLYDPSKYDVVAFVLKKDGRIVDVLGDPNSTSPFMPSGGTIIRKTGIYTGSQAFSLEGEWDILPKGSFQFIGYHTP